MKLFSRIFMPVMIGIVALISYKSHAGELAGYVFKAAPVEYKNALNAMHGLETTVSLAATKPTASVVQRQMPALLKDVHAQTNEAMALNANLLNTKQKGLEFLYLEAKNDPKRMNFGLRDEYKKLLDLHKASFEAQQHLTYLQSLKDAINMAAYDETTKPAALELARKVTALFGNIDDAIAQARSRVNRFNDAADIINQNIQDTYGVGGIRSYQGSVPGITVTPAPEGDIEFQ